MTVTTYVNDKEVPREELKNYTVNLLCLSRGAYRQEKKGGTESVRGKERD